MSKVRDPRTKKRLSLKRDHRLLKPLADETARRKALAKASLHQRLRRAEHAALNAARLAPEAAELAVREARSARKGKRQKRPAVSLAQVLAQKTRERGARARSAVETRRKTRRRRARAATARQRAKARSAR